MKNEKHVQFKKESQESERSENSQDDESKELSNKSEASVISDLSLDKIDNPRQRELLLLAKLKIVKEKLNNKNNLINNLKETLESDDKVKKAMNDKISDLKSRIENYREEALKHGVKIKGLDLEESQENHQLLQVDEEENLELVNNKRNGLKYMLNTSALANEHQNILYMVKNKTCCGKFKHSCYNLLEFFLPFKEDIKHLDYRYDRDIQRLFSNMRFIVIISFGIFFIYLYFLITHALNSDFTGTNIFCKFSLPCFMFYSRVKESEAQAFSISFLIYTLFITIAAVIRSLYLNRLLFNSKLYEKEDKFFPKFFFKVWDWSIKTKENYIEKKRRLRESLKQSLIADSKYDKIKTVPDSNSCGKWALRIFSIFLTILIVILYVGLVIFAYVVRAILVSKDTTKSSWTSIDVIYEILPSLIIIFSHIFFPWLLMILVYMEGWQTYSTQFSLTNLRYLLGKFIGIGSVLFYNIYFVILGQRQLSIGSLISYTISTHGCPGTYVMNSGSSLNSVNLISRTIYSECAEDDAIINMLFISLGEYFARKLWEIMYYTVHFCCNRKKRRIGESYKIPYNSGVEAINIMTTTVQLMILITYFPYIAFLLPLILWMEFKYQMFKLIRLSSKPLRDDSIIPLFKIRSFLTNFCFATLIVVNTLFYISLYPHANYLEARISDSLRCGPYPTMTAVSSTLLQGISSNSFFSFIYYVTSNPEPLIIILIILLSFVCFKSEDFDTCKFYVKENEKEMNYLINKLQMRVEDLGEEKKQLVVERLNRRRSYFNK